MKTIIIAASAAALSHAMLTRDSELPEQMTRELPFEVRAESIDEEKRTVELSFSSEEPYARWWGTEIHPRTWARSGRGLGRARSG
ncbi:MAG: hypothetical protein KBO59_23965, partial [Achromobacter sp.]|nr:hypothetical protein [Achromobacter sp.]